MEQPDLFEKPSNIRDRLYMNKPYDDLEAKFFDYHVKNLDVYKAFLRYAEEAYKTRSHYSARDIISRVRWWMSIETDSEDGYKINNNHSPYYARLAICDRPKFEGFFETRKVASDAA